MPGRQLPKRTKPKSRTQLTLIAALAIVLVLASIGISVATHDSSSVARVIKRLNPLTLAHHIFAV